MRMVDYKLTCLNILLIYPATVPSSQLIGLAGMMLGDKLDKEDQVINKAGQIQWHRNIYNALILLKSSGFAENSSRGWWRLSDKGKEWMNAYGNADWEICCTNLSKQRWNSQANGQSYDPLPPTDLDNNNSARPQVEQQLSTLDENKLGSIAKSIALKIQDILNQKIPFYSDDDLCGLVEFCYRLELYAEGACLFSLIDANKIEPSFYTRTSRIASVCKLHSFE